MITETARGARLSGRRPRATRRSGWPRPTPSWPPPTPARTAAASRCTPSTCRPTPTPPTCRERWGRAAIDAGRRARRRWPALRRSLGLSDELAAEVAPRVEAKLAAEPIEDLRLDFEDGYGNRGDDAEDAEAVRAAARTGRSRRRRAGAGLRRPAVQVLRGTHPPPRRADPGSVPCPPCSSTATCRTNLVITFPKVSTVSQVEAMVAVCEAYETRGRAAAGPAALRDPGGDPAAHPRLPTDGCPLPRPSRPGRAGSPPCTTARTTTAPRSGCPRSTSRWPTRPPTSPRR